MNYFEAMLGLSLLGATVLMVCDFSFSESIKTGIAMNKNDRDHIQALKHSAIWGTFFFITFITEFILVGRDCI